MKRFIFRFVVSYTHDITLNEDQIYPSYPWHLYPEHSDARTPTRLKKNAKLTVARVMQSVRANGGPDAILKDWNLDPDSTTKVSRRVALTIRPAQRPKSRNKKKL